MAKSLEQWRRQAQLAEKHGDTGAELEARRAIKLMSSTLEQRQATEAQRISRVNQPIQQQTTGVEDLLGAGEVAAAALTDIPARAVGGIVGGVAAPFVGAERGAEISENIRGELAFPITSQAGQQLAQFIGRQQGLKQVGEFLTDAQRGAETIGSGVAEFTGVPALGAAITAGGQALPELVELLSARGIGKVKAPIQTPDGILDPSRFEKPPVDRVEPVFGQPENLTKFVEDAGKLGVTPEQLSKMTKQQVELLKAEIGKTQVAITPEFLKQAQEAGLTAEQVESATPQQLQAIQTSLEQAKTVRAVEQATQEGVFKGKGRAAGVEEVARQVKPDPEIVATAKRLGVDISDIPENVISSNPDFRAVFGALQSVPGSPAATKKKNLLLSRGAAAEKKLKQFGAELDTGAVGVKLRKEMIDEIDAIKRVEESVYNIDLKQAVIDGSKQKNPIIRPKIVQNRINQRIADVGGKEFISDIERTMLARLGSETRPTWARLDDVRKELNASRKNQGAFKDMDAGEIELYAGLVRADQKAIAESFGAGEFFELAMDSTSMRKTLEKETQALFGKNLDKSLRKVMDVNLKNLEKGDVFEFNKAINSIPKESRKNVLLNSIADKMINFANEDKFLESTKFSQWWNQLDKNKTAKAALIRELPDDVVKYLDDEAKLSSAIKRAGEDFIATGRINSLSEAFTAKDRAMEILVNGGKATAAAGASLVAGPGAGMVIRDVLKGKSKGVNTVDKAAAVMASPQFQNLVKDIALNVEPKKIQKSAVIIERTPAWKKYVKALDKDAQLRLQTLGVVEFLKQSEEEQ